MGDGAEETVRRRGARVHNRGAPRLYVIGGKRDVDARSRTGFPPEMKFSRDT